MTELAVESAGLTKRFGRQLAVDDLDIAVPRGSVFGFLGPNGSGKTTTIRLLLGLAAATSGEARVLGREVPRGLGAVLPRVGALVEGPAHYPFLSGEANLRRLDAADPHASPRTRDVRVAAALARVGLSHAGSKRVRAYSLGMKQRLGIAGALLMPRELLVLDEPTNGLDPQGTREVRALVRSLAHEGATVLVSSHLLAEVEQICSHIGVMSRGRLVAQGSLAELRSSGRAHVRVETPDPGPARRELARLGLSVADDDAGSAGRPGATELTDAAEQADAAGAADAAEQTPHRDRRTAARDTAEEADVPEEAGAAAAAGTAGRTEGSSAVVVAALPDPAPLPEMIAATLVAAGVRLRAFGVVEETLEERFVALTGEGFDVAQ